MFGTRLTKNIMDVVTEDIVKLGYMEEALRLFYPLASLQNFFDEKADVNRMNQILQEYLTEVKDIFGEIQITEKNQRYCFVIPKEGVSYIHEHMGEQGFIVELVELVRRHGCTMEQIKELFFKYSNQVCIEKKENQDFDYLFYFKNGEPNEYFYCFHEEMCHIIYHRYLPMDYYDLFPEENSEKNKIQR